MTPTFAGEGAVPGPKAPGMVQSRGVVRASLANDLYEVELEGGRLVVAHLDAAFRLQAGRGGPRAGGPGALRPGSRPYHR